MFATDPIPKLYDYMFSSFKGRKMSPEIAVEIAIRGKQGPVASKAFSVNSGG